MNRKQLLDWLSRQGYKGKPEPTEIQAFLDEQNLILQHANGTNLDVGAALKLESKSVVVVKDDDDETDDQSGQDSGSAQDGEESEDSDTVSVKKHELDELRRKAARGNGAKRAAGAENPDLKFHIGNIERKEYNRKAARGETVYPDADYAEVAGAYFRKAVFGNRYEYPNAGRDAEILKKTQTGTDLSAGGYLVPEILQPSLINLQEQYGDFQRHVGITPMVSDNMTMPRLASGLTVYSPSQGGAITTSDVGLEQVSLSAFDMWTLTYISEQLMMDGALSMADVVSKQIAQAFAVKTDQIYVLGDGTSTYFNQEGIRGAYERLVTGAGGTWPTNYAYASGIAIAAGNAFDEVTYDNILDLIARTSMVPGAQKAFYCSQQFWTKVLLKLAKRPGSSGATGGVTQTEVINGAPSYSFDGYPVRICAAMPQRDANSQFACVFGDLSLGTKIGMVRNSYAIKSNDSVGFASGTIAIRGQVRMAVNCHDLGKANSSSTGDFGPVSALLMAAS